MDLTMNGHGIYLTVNGRGRADVGALLVGALGVPGEATHKGCPYNLSSGRRVADRPCADDSRRDVPASRAVREDVS
jgi:hypothetical protein